MSQLRSAPSCCRQTRWPYVKTSTGGKFGSVKAKSRRRNVPLSTAVVAALQRLRSESQFANQEDLVVASSTGNPLDEKNMLRRHLKPVGKKRGIPWVSWHVFRH